MSEPSFGAELRRRRIAAALSLDALAKRAFISKGYLSKLENDRQRPSDVAARACDVALGANGDLLALHTGPAAATSVERSPDTVPTSSWTLRLAPDGSGSFVPVAMTADTPEADVAMLGLEISARGAMAAARSDRSLRHHRAQFDSLRGYGRAASPSLVLPALVTHLNTVRAIAAHAEPELRAALLRLAARYAEFAGWMAQEAGDPRASAWWTALAVAEAEAGGDRGLAAFALYRRAELAYDREDPKTAARLTRQVQESPTAGARVKALAAYREAHAHARLADTTAAFTALDRARELFADAAADDTGDPVLGGTSATDPVEVARGWCLYDLGQPEAAAAILDQHVSAMSADSVRARTLFGVRRAAAHAAAGDVEHACELALMMIDDIALVDSAGVRAEVKALCHELRKKQSNPTAQHALHRLAETLRLA